MNPSENIDKQIAELPDWRGKTMTRLRELINDADPALTEDWKWGTAVWTRNGNVVALGAFKDHLKLNFFHGARLSDAHGLFNAGLDAKESRSIDIGEGDKLDEAMVKELIRAAATANEKKPRATSKK
jgi:hypothetical protein